jgi:serine protease Do
MKKITLTTILVFAFILSACGPAASLTNQASGLVSSPSNATQQQAAPVVQVAQVAQATQPPVIPSSEASGLLAAYEGALESVYTQVNPSVVNIRVVMQASTSGNSSSEIPGFPFNFPGMPQLPQLPQQPQTPEYGQALGSGFVWDTEGHIVTNNHVVEGADKIEVTFSDGTTVSAQLVGADPDSDLAVIKVDAPTSQLKPVQLADFSQVRVGQLAVAIGNPYGLEGTMTVGIVSALGRTMPASENLTNGPVYSIPDVVQTDAPINPGNSGGVLVDDMGHVIGVTAAIQSTTGANAGIGFAIPVSIVQKVVPSLIQNGSYAHSYLGISGTDLTLDLAKAMNLPDNQRGALISEVVTGGPADKAGLRGSNQQVQIDGQQALVGGDVIVAINGQSIESMDDLITYLTNSTSVGDQVTLTILRDGSQKSVQVTLEARPGSNVAQTTTTSPQPQNGQAHAWLGIVGGTLTPDEAQAMNLDQNQTGVLVEQVQSGSPADKGGLMGSFKPFTIQGQQIMIGGDVITAIDGHSVETIQDLTTLLGQYQPGDQVTLIVLRNGEQIQLTVTLGEPPQ